MNWITNLLPYYKVAKWLLAESGYYQKVATWLASENEWYFQLAAAAWGELYVADPNALKPVLLAQAQHPLTKVIPVGNITHVAEVLGTDLPKGSRSRGRR